VTEHLGRLRIERTASTLSRYRVPRGSGKPATIASTRREGRASGSAMIPNVLRKGQEPPGRTKSRRLSRG
jgi:hypothetical protein